jgi:type VI secretion system protein ImpH
MGLYGIDSPLPVYFYDAIATESDRYKPLRDFLDIFNHRLYSLFYRSWKKYRPVLHYKPLGEDTYSQRALCLAGLGTKKAFENAKVSPLRLAAFAGRLSCRIRNAEGLQKLIRDFFVGIGVSIIENVPRWVPIVQRPRMSKNGGVPLALGTTATIGEKVFDVSGKFRIVLGPLTLAQYVALLPGEESAQILHYLVRLYTPDDLDFDVVLLLKTAEIPPLRLGDKSVQMGLTTWSGRPKGEVTARVVGYESA